MLHPRYKHSWKKHSMCATLAAQNCKAWVCRIANKRLLCGYQSSLQSSGLRMWRVEGSGFWSFSFRLQAFRLHMANAQSPLAHLLAHTKPNPGKDPREQRSSMFRKEICRYFDVRNTTCSSFMWEPLERISFYGE